MIGKTIDELTIGETAQRLGISKGTVKRWRAHGLLRARLLNDRNEYLFEPPGPDAPVKCQGRRLSDRLRPRQFGSEPYNEVQYGT